VHYPSDVLAVDVPDLAASTPLWLGLATVFVNSVLGALRGYADDTRRWDIVGVAVFALLMGLGGGFIRDLLLGNLPAESLREPWYVAAVAAAVVVVAATHRWMHRIAPLTRLGEAVGLGLFAVVGVAYAREAGLPPLNTVLIGTLSAVGGGMLVSVLQGQVPRVLLASTPHALLAVVGSATYAVAAPWRSDAASFAGIAVVVVAQYLVDHFGVETRPAAPRSRT
jgi:uncharacterized membrane protein YeiH